MVSPIPRRCILPLQSGQRFQRAEQLCFLPSPCAAGLTLGAGSNDSARADPPRGRRQGSSRLCGSSAPNDNEPDEEVESEDESI